MATYTITVTAPTGQVHTRTVDVPLFPDWPTNLQDTEAGAVSDVDAALWLAAPEICPFDCDHCRD